MIDHKRMYSIVLAAVGAMAALSSGFLLVLTGASLGGAFKTHLPEWSLPLVAAINSCYALAILIVLCARKFNPESGRRLTPVLNWALLPALPGGTVVGLYGLLKADKISPAHR